MIATDLKTVNNALYIDPAKGDFVIVSSDDKHIVDIIRANQGEWKEFPNVGVGIFSFLNGAFSDQQLEREIKIQLQGDGYTVENTRVKFITANKLEIKPNAIRE